MAIAIALGPRVILRRRGVVVKAVIDCTRWMRVQHEPIVDNRDLGPTCPELAPNYRERRGTIGCDVLAWWPLSC